MPGVINPNVPATIWFPRGNNLLDSLREQPVGRGCSGPGGPSRCCAGRQNSAKDARPRVGTLAARTPTGEGIGAPISNTAVRTIGAVEGVTGISIGTDDPTARAARRVGSAGGTDTGLANPLMTYGRCLVGAGGGPDPIGRGERN